MLLCSRAENSSKYFGKRLLENNHIVRLPTSCVPMLTLARPEQACQMAPHVVLETLAYLATVDLIPILPQHT